MNDLTRPADSGAAGSIAAPRRVAAVEIPTLLITLLAYGGWSAVTLMYGRWPLWLVAPVGAVLVTLHGSLQHEIVHGHPTRWGRINRLLAMVPLSIWLPFDSYRVSHLAHHVDERLTDPLDDPESWYWTAEDWARLSPLSRAVVHISQTLAGRVTIGAFWTIGRYLRGEWRALLANREGARAMWLEHLLWCIPVICWVQVVCGMPLWLYMLTIAIPGTGITLIRSFAEHRARPAVRGRIALVEESWILGPLFLFNNLHALHHEAPWVPWYEYPARYRCIRERLILENGGLVYRTYFDVAWRFLLRPHDSPLHPTGRVPTRASWDLRRAAGSPQPSPRDPR
ncbi:MAG TPA: fatty acid desaturase [Steroidobacteraceae bacterium]|nr:fatty acid desaturase [Steroidobacteraceae bacterium]